MVKKTKSKVADSKGGKFFPLPKKIKKTIISILFFLFAIVMFFSFFGLSGMAGEYLKDFFTSFIGLAVYIMPIALFLVGLVVIKTKYKRFAVPMVASFLLIAIGFSGMLEILSSSNILEIDNAGGTIGDLIGSPLIKLFDFWIALFVFTAFIFGGCLVFLQLLSLPSVLRTNDELKESFTSKIFRWVIGKNSEFKEKELKFDEPVKKEEEKKPEPVKEDVLPDKNLNGFKLPPLDLLESESGAPSTGDIKVNSAIIKKTLEDFDIPVEMSGVNVGPTVAQYTLKPAEGIKLSKITSLSNDLSLSLAAHSIRIEAPIPGKSLVGVEIPNKIRAEVRLRNMIESPDYQKIGARLPIAMGKDVSGIAVYTRLEKMPHLLVAGSTGSGKTIFLNTLILSILYNNTPETLRLILVDPKRVEFSHFKDTPHLLCPVIFDVDRASNVLKWSVLEMERRLKVMSEAKTRDIGSYNDLVSKNNKKKGNEPMEVMPYIVIIVDELADLMVSKGKEIEPKIVRLAQMARATGIHLVLATQRPSVEVITGLIKANIVSRVSFQVASQVDSRTIIDTAGAEKLLGAGDMLYVTGDMPKPKRVQAPYVSEKEIKGVVNWIKTEYGETMEGDSLCEDLEKGLEEATEGTFDFYDGENDPLYEEARTIVIENKKASASFLQRRLRVGYARAARLIDMMEERGVVGPADGAKPREVYTRNIEDSGSDEWKGV
ncbi:MAG: DNA translocase SpoIIIE [Parcubacteria group bacterium ADurb.Bin247]|nr:MAG: DNA translocase SpoIIIE [Parcubacteria group bacterium ADurb.Bin247]